MAIKIFYSDKVMANKINGHKNDPINGHLSWPLKSGQINGHEICLHMF